MRSIIDPKWINGEGTETSVFRVGRPLRRGVIGTYIDSKQHFSIKIKDCCELNDTMYGDGHGFVKLFA
ncbi:hypothetical protein [Membranihabitans marinus]|uniref:hypothetical protein n=1 Tax=Membranihabitans marinus TaxID=1227546 RepID=UPI001F3A79D7|nr:hypothetical protein [Membranihabitans marinus]